MKSSIEQRATKFVHDIYPFIKNCKSVGDYIERVAIYNKVTHRKVKVCNGAVRVCFVLSDYCVKIDFNAYGADCYGGCEDEYNFYKYAEEVGYDYLFAYINKIEVCGRTWYVMERINNTCSEDYEWEYAENLVDVDECAWLQQNCQDLHNNNFGFKNGRVVIVDYAYNKLFKERVDYYGESEEETHDSCNSYQET